MSRIHQNMRNLFANAIRTIGVRYAVCLKRCSQLCILGLMCRNQIVYDLTETVSCPVLILLALGVFLVPEPTLPGAGNTKGLDIPDN
jgi:hypothetical protein